MTDMNDESRDIEFGSPTPPPFPEPASAPPPSPAQNEAPAEPVADSSARFAGASPSAWSPEQEPAQPVAGFGAVPPPAREFASPGGTAGQDEEPAESVAGFGEMPSARSGQESARGVAGGRRARRAKGRGEPALGGVLGTARKVAAHRYGTAGLVLVAVAAVYGVAVVSRPGGVPVHRGEVIPVDSAVVVCPEVARARVGVAATGGGTGEAVVRDLKGKPVTTLTQPGVGWAATAGKPGALVVEAQGALAGGLSVTQTTQTKRALAGTSCTAPGTEHWFVSPGPGAGTVELFLANADDVPATVDLHAISDDGSLATTDGKSLEVPARGSRTVRIGRSADGLGAVAAEVQVIALRVTASSGRVAAAVRTGLGSGGVDWVPATAGPSREVVVPGLPGGRGKRTLYVGAPGDVDARVQIRVVTSAGVFAPEGQDVLDVPADTVIPLDLEAALGGRAAAVVLTSKQGLVAGFSAGGEGGGEVGYGAATEPLGEGGTVADARTGSRLLLTAPERAAKVRVTPLGRTGPETAQEVTLEAGRTVEVPVTADGARIEPLPGSGPVYGARVLTVKAGRFRPTTVLPLAPAPVRIRLPAVGGSLTAVLEDS